MSIDANAPRDPRPLIGRRHALERLRARLDANRLVTVVGACGVGKSRLIGDVAVDTDNQRCHVVELRGVAKMSGLIARVADALECGAPPDDIHTSDWLAEQLADDTAHLLVLDNADTIVDSLRDRAAGWLRAVPGLTLLVTSRARLGIAIEFLVELDTLATQVPESTDQRMSDAGRLLSWHLDRLGITHEESSDQVEALAARLDGLPLAIETTLSSVEVLGIDAVLRHLDQDPLAILGATRPGPAITLESSFRDSWDRLDATQRSTLSHLSLFPGSFTVDAAEQLVDSGDSERPVLSVIRELRDRSLLRRLPTEDGRAPRLELHVATRAFARAQLSEPAREKVSVRHASLVTADVRDMVERLRPLDESTRSRLQEHRDSLEAVLEGFGAREDDDARAFFCVAAVALDSLEPGCVVPEQALEWVSNHARSDRIAARALRLLARRAVQNARYDEAEALFRRALESVSGDVDRAVLMADRGRLARRTGRLDRARRYHERAVELIADAGDAKLRARFESEHAGLLFEMDCTSEAIDGMHRALAMHRDSGNRRSEGVALSNLGQMLHEQGRLDEAMSFHEEALELHRASNHARFEAISKFDMGVLAHERGWLRRARRLHLDALEGLERHGHPRMIALVSGSLGAVEARLQIDSTTRFARARELFRKHDEQVFDVAVDFYEQVAEIAGRIAEHADEHIDLEPLSEPGDLSGWTDEVRFARRILERLHAHASNLSAGILVSQDHRWFRGPHCEPADLSTRDTLSQVFSRLIRARLDGEPRVSRQELVAAGWPDEDILASSATNRLNVSLSQLRKLGLAEVLKFERDGYTLDPSAPLFLC